MIPRSRFNFRRLFTSSLPISPLSTVAVGTAFELYTSEILSSFSFHLSRSGGANDQGVDLHGFWKLSSKIAHPVIIQTVLNFQIMSRNAKHGG
jgi:hypothetical protein